MTQTAGELKEAMKNFATVFASALAIYLFVFAGHYVSGDEAHRIAWAKSLIDCHCNNIAAYFPGEQYSKYGIGVSLLHVPLILLARLIKTETGLSTEGPVNMLLYTFNAAFGVALIYLLLARERLRPRAAALGSLGIRVDLSSRRFHPTDHPSLSVPGSDVICPNPYVAAIRRTKEPGNNYLND